MSPETPTAPDSHSNPTSTRPLFPFKDALVPDGLPFTSFAVDDVAADYERLTGRGVGFTQPPTDMGPVTTAVFDDTCGNLIQLASGNSVVLSSVRNPSRRLALSRSKAGDACLGRGDSSCGNHVSWRRDLDPG